MTSAAVNIQNRFRGALVGVLIGDCFGAPFEGRRVNPAALTEQIDAMVTEGEHYFKYTDDTAMTKSTCKSLIVNKGLDPRHLAREYSEGFFKEPRRGYGAAVRQVFSLLRETNYHDPFGPASKQFEGTGSFGNGAAMRCNGIALFAHIKKLDFDQTRDLTENCSRITHSHIYGINGAVLLVEAIRHVLSLPDETIDESSFLDHLIGVMSGIEQEDKMFTNKLASIKKVIEKTAITGTDINQNEIVELLGNDVSAQNSVPLSIYSFLRGTSKFIDTYQIENEFKRTLHWAISCGGDTDTIASMACGLSGAYMGINKIPENLYKKCEAWEEMASLADQLSSIQ